MLDAVNYREARTVEQRPGQPEKTTVTINHGDNGDAAAAKLNLDRVVDTARDREGRENEKEAPAHHETTGVLGEVGEGATATKSLTTSARCRRRERRIPGDSLHPGKHRSARL